MKELVMEKLRVGWEIRTVKFEERIVNDMGRNIIESILDRKRGREME